MGNNHFFDGSITHRVKFILWDCARRVPIMNKPLRIAARTFMGGIEDAWRQRLARDLDQILPDDRYCRPLNVPTQAWIVAPEKSAKADVRGVSLWLNHMRIPYRQASPETFAVSKDAKKAILVLAPGLSVKEAVDLRETVAPLALFALFKPPIETSMESCEYILGLSGPASRLLPHRDGLRSEFAGAFVKILRNDLMQPLVTGMLPSEVAIRLDDVHGRNIGTYLPPMINHGWCPNLGIFVDSFRETGSAAAAEIAGFVTKGAADVSPHAFSENRFSFYDYPRGRPYSETVFRGIWEDVRTVLNKNLFPLSPVINAHFHSISHSATKILADDGARFFFSELAIDAHNTHPGTGYWPSGDPVNCTGYLDPSGIVQISAGDNIIDMMNPGSLYDFLGSLGAESHIDAKSRIHKKLKLSLDCGFPAYVTTHEYKLNNWSVDDYKHKALWDSVDLDLNEMGWGTINKVPIATLGYRCAEAGKCVIWSVEQVGSQLNVVLKGGSSGADRMRILHGGRATETDIPSFSITHQLEVAHHEP